MPKRSATLELDVDLEGGVVPISKAASALAALLKRARDRRQPIIVTQKGYPAGVILDVELYTTLRELAAEVAVKGQPQEAPAAEPAAAPEPEAAEATPARKGRGGRKRSA